MRLFICICLFVVNVSSCQSQEKSTDEIIKKFDTVDFSSLKNRSVYFRSAGQQRNSSIYFVNTMEGTCSPYIVEVNNSDNTIIEIKNNLVISSCKEDFLSQNEIEKTIKQYLQYKICLLQVDNDGNVLINPDKQEPATLLRMMPGKTIENMNQFKPLKGNWYIRK